MKEALDRLGPEALASAGAAAAARLGSMAPWKDAPLVLAFLSMPGEIDTAPLLAAARRAGKAVAVPRIEGARLDFRLMPADAGPLPRDRWDIPVPDPAWPPLPSAPRGALIVVPGLAFDRKGNRLGRGKGYYDGFLADAAGWDARTAVGFCLSLQVVSEVPTDAHDVCLDGLVTDAESLRFR